MRTYNLTPGRELLFACRYRLGTASNFVVYMSEADNVYDPLYGSFVGDQGAWSTAKMYFTVPPNGVAKLHFGAHFQAPGLPNQTAGTVDVYGLQILDATLETGNAVEAEEDTAASALLLKHELLDGGADDVTLATLGEVLLEPTLTTLGNFLVRSNSQSSVASASFTVGGFRHDPERLCLEHRAHLHADAGETLLLRLPVQAGHGHQLGDVRQRGRQRLRGLYSMQIRASAFEGESVSVTDLLADSLALTGSATLDGLTAQGMRPAAVQRRELHRRVHHGRGRLGHSLLRRAHSHRHRRRGRAVVHRGRVRQLAEHQRRGQRGPAELRHGNHGQHADHQQHGQRRELHHGGRRVHGDIDGLGRSNRGELRSHRGAHGRHADDHRCGLHGPAGLREPGLHLHGHERWSVDGQRGLRRRDELGHGRRSSSPPTRSS